MISRCICLMLHPCRINSVANQSSSSGLAGCPFQTDENKKSQLPGIKVRASGSSSQERTLKNTIVHDHQNDGIDRRGFLQCMAWAGTGVIWTIGSGMASSRAFGQKPHAEGSGGFSFVQISDSHMGFNKPANPDVTATLQAAVDKINTLAAARRISSSTPATSRTHRNRWSSTPWIRS